MKWSFLPQYGHACCPHCLKLFDFSLAKPTFYEDQSNGDSIFYVMCISCNAGYQAGDDATRKAICNKCITNFKLRGVSASGALTPFAITTGLALAVNGGNLLDAIEKGHGLSRAQYFFLTGNHGTQDITEISSSIFCSMAEGNTR